MTRATTVTAARLYGTPIARRPMATEEMLASIAPTRRRMTYALQGTTVQAVRD